MKIKILAAAGAALTLAAVYASADPLGTAFTYQGKLTDGANAANGIYDFRFTVFDAVTNGNALTGMLTNAATPLSNGLFTVTLDFGANVFTGDARWLQIGVRPSGGGAFTSLSPRQPLTPSPYALYAPAAGSAAMASTATTASNALAVINSAVTADTIAGGQVVKSLNALHDQVTLSAGTNVNLSIAGNEISISATPGTVVTNAGWSLTGNSGNSPSYFLGTTDGQPLDFRVSNTRALRLFPTADTPNLIGGYSGNRVALGVVGGTIGGGGMTQGAQPNIITNNGQYGIIAGGYNNTVTNYGGAVLGGAVNFNGGYFATIGAGYAHTNLGDLSSIGGGQYNTIRGDFSTIGGGYANEIRVGARSSSIGSGEWNVIGISAQYSTIAGGSGGTIAKGAAQSTIAGGYQNTITNSGGAVLGGSANFDGGYFGAIGAGQFHTNLGNYAWIGGGQYNAIQADFSTVGGGFANQILAGAGSSSIGSGEWNVIGTNAYYSTIAGGSHGTIMTGAPMSTIGGGYQQTIGDGSDSATISGGYRNYIAGSASAVTIAGGAGNWVAQGAYGAVISGGDTNGIALNAPESVVAGGMDNQVGNYAYLGAIGGGAHNRVYGAGGTVPGGNHNWAGGLNSLAAGTDAWAEHDGTFVWADCNAVTFGSTAPNQFLIRAAGGVGINTTAPGASLAVQDTSSLNRPHISIFENGANSLARLQLQTAGQERWQIAAGGPNNYLYFWNATAKADVMTVSSNGTVYVNVLTIQGGADVAEPFPMSQPEITKGSVVIIDEANPGQLKLSERAYDTRVAGVVSGANGVRPGLSLSQPGLTEGGQNVALSGRVYVQADATYGAIQPGDPLTTSDTPGHAMRVTDHARAQGAILGKAMTGLTEGTGFVLVLVTLQ